LGTIAAMLRRLALMLSLAVLVAGCTESKAEAALLTVEDLPPGWSVDEDGWGVHAEPARCGALLDGMESVPVTPLAEAKVKFTQGSVHLRHAVASYEAPAAGALQTVAETVAACSSFVVFDDGGSGSRIQLSSLAFPNLGDRTVAIRTGFPDSRPFAADLVMIAVGHEVILLSPGGVSPMSGDTLEAIARTAIAKLGRSP
jgi:hypothetical protein